MLAALPASAVGVVKSQNADAAMCGGLQGKEAPRTGTEKKAEAEGEVVQKKRSSLQGLEADTGRVANAAVEERKKTVGEQSASILWKLRERVEQL